MRSDPVPMLQSPRARALEATMASLLDLFEAACGVQVAFHAAVHEDGGASHYAYERGSGLVETLARPAPVPARAASGGRASALRASTGLQSCDGTWLGTLDVASLSGAPVPDDCMDMLRCCARVIGTLLDASAGTVAAVPDAPDRGVALLDALTGFPNRQALTLELDRMLARAQRDDMTVFVVCVGLADGDAPGCNARLDGGVVELATCLGESVRGGDVIARTGPHAFAVAGSIPRSTAEASAAVVLERLGARCSRIPGPGARCGRLEMGFALAGIGAYDAEALLVEAEAGLAA